MFICEDCGETFLEPSISYDTVPYGDGYVKGPGQASCPYCHGNFEEGKKCEHCGNYFLESRMNEICEDCLDELQTRFSNMLHNNFTEYEIKALNTIYEGKDLK